MLAFAHSLPRPDALLTPLAPGEAYAADVVRLNGREPLGPADDAWLVLAHALARAAQLPAGQRAPVLTSGGDAVAAVLPAGAPEALRSAVLAAADGLRVIAGALGRPARARHARAGSGAAGAVHAAAGAVQAVVAQQEQAGAFLLAFSTLAALRAAAAPVLDARGEGLLLAQQGRVARQAGALATAAELYAESARAARAARAADVLARALIGAGSLATVRGNYPEARSLYRRALAAADSAKADEYLRAGHHGLMVAALVARDVETALAHGWAAFRRTETDSADTRAEVLVNLGSIAREVGEHRASLGACLTALELTDVPRIRLPALGTAALAAAHLGERPLLTFLVRDLERVVARSGEPFETARALVEFAEATTAIHDSRAASMFAGRAAIIADRGQLHEVAARAEAVRSSLLASEACAFAPNRRAGWNTRTQSVIRSLERLSDGTRYAALAAR